ncbi:MAG TPA: SIS domain-containing protein [Nitrososphaerales archaeon]|nr:SIS domain-containing protein [Nitrososphaerales archaeon]
MKVAKAPEGSIFVGAGDSYAAALAGFYSSMGDCMGVDPYTIATVPQITRGREVFFISVSGRTSSNLLAARKVKRLAKKTTLVTAVPGSKLAAMTDQTVTLPMVYVPRTPGMLSFSLSLLAVLKMVMVTVSCDFERAFASAQLDHRKFSFGGGTNYFLGNSMAYPVALYAAAKTYEFLGSKAHAELLEEFSHLELFSLKKSDSVNLFGCFDPAGKSRNLARSLAAHGYRAGLIPARGKSVLERIFHSVFVSQLAVLDGAEAAGLSEPRFLSDDDKLEISDTMIYKSGRF